MEIEKVSKVIGAIIIIAGLGWSGQAILSDKPSHVQVASSLDERDYTRYEERIAEKEEEIIDVKYHSKGMSDEEKLERVEKIQKSIRNYEKRQKRLNE